MDTENHSSLETILSSRSLTESLEHLLEEVPHLSQRMGTSDDHELTIWQTILRTKLIPRLSPDMPMIAAICGGGSSGKSTLFNTLMGEILSPTGGYAGLNRRILIGLHPQDASGNHVLPWLETSFRCRLEKLTHPGELTQPGNPMYVLRDTIPPGIALMDTPDFDTGAKGVYFNRDAAATALELADLIIYIFTNATYNNRENTDFLSQILTQIGQRKSLLVYRVYPGFEPDDVSDHASTVARHLYGRHADHHVLGVYRAHEDNRVAAGEKLLQTAPLVQEELSLADALQRLDPTALRTDLLATILADIYKTAEMVFQKSTHAVHALELYLNVLRAAQSDAARHALTHFPMDRVMKRFTEIWQTSDPPHIQFMRKTGRILEVPWRVLVGSAKRVQTSLGSTKKAPANHTTELGVEHDLIQAMSRIQAQSVHTHLTVSLAMNDPDVKQMQTAAETIRQHLGPSHPGSPQWNLSPDTGMVEFSIPLPPALASAQVALTGKDWKSTFGSISAKAEIITTLSDAIDRELQELVNEFRDRMGLWDQLRQTFAAVLNVIPATAAITYILTTGDPVGAAGIKVKLTGLFGLHDLYALVAVPATSGMKKADQRQLENFLGPIAKTWLNHKLLAVQTLIEREITGTLFAAGKTIMDDAARGMATIENALPVIKKALRKP